jgi:phosphoribosylanthranilate isomerase
MSPGTLIKVCGLTRLADARVAHEAGADWLGMVLLGESPRRIAVETAREIAAALDGAVTVAVLVAPTPEQAWSLASAARATRVQLHRVDPLTWPADFPLPVSFVVPIAEDGSLTIPLPDPRHVVVLDTADPKQAGGTGRTFPWATAGVVAATREVFLAGGLAGDNVTAALDAVRPRGVDASSRLETAPGVKDEQRVRAFVEAVRAWDAKATGEGAAPEAGA